MYRIFKYEITKLYEFENILFFQKENIFLEYCGFFKILYLLIASNFILSIRPIIITLPNGEESLFLSNNITFQIKNIFEVKSL